MKPIIAIVGRPNVGKSTLFNRLLKKQVAIVEDLPGTTRDRVFADALLHDHEVTLIDTGGLSILPDTVMGKKIKKQVEAAMTEADVILFMVDAIDGVIASDSEIADQIRKSRKPVILVVNKVDNPKLEGQVANFYQLGLDKLIPISAHHNRGIADLIDMITEVLPAQVISATEVANIPKIAIVGRPNVGKSMLLNAILGEERSIVDNVPGTTRDAIDTIYNFQGQDMLLIDTAGIRRRGKSGTGIDFYSLIRSIRAIDRCDVALLVVDSSEMITAQDLHVAGFIKQAYKGLVLVVNKFDLVPDEDKGQLDGYFERKMKFMSQVPILYVSAKYGDGVKSVLPAALEIWRERQKLLPNSVVDKLMKSALEANAPPPKGLRRLNIIRAFQDGINPPSFTLLVNDPDLVHFSYQRYLENTFRKTFGFFGTPLRLYFKKTPRRKSRKSEAATDDNS
jgi:GTPase